MAAGVKVYCTLKRNLTYCSLNTKAKPVGKDNLAIQLDRLSKSVLFGSRAVLPQRDRSCCCQSQKKEPLLKSLCFKSAHLRLI